MSCARHQGSRQVKAKRHPSPRQGRRRRLSRSPRCSSSSWDLQHQVGAPRNPAQSAVHLHTKSEGHRRIVGMATGRVWTGYDNTLPDTVPVNLENIHTLKL